MIRSIFSNLSRLCSHLRWPLRRRQFKATTVVVHKPAAQHKDEAMFGSTRAPSLAESSTAIRIATFNAAMFSMAPAVAVQPQQPPTAIAGQPEHDIRCKTANDRLPPPPKSILKQKSLSKSKRRVSINLPDNQISLERSKQSVSNREEEGLMHRKGKSPLTTSFSFPANSVASRGNSSERETESLRSNRSVLDVLREVGADIIGLQNVKAEEEKGMKPLSELADGLGMKYVFAESWAPEYGNAILSKWPIKRWKVQKICDDSDFRNVLKATIEVPKAGEINFHCTYLDHLDENWRMKQINSILRTSNEPHILAGGLNSLDETDYSAERWADIVKYYEEIGKPTPKVEVTKYLKSQGYVDAKDFAGECEAIVVVAKGQDVQGTCKYGTRVDYLLASPDSPYKFVPRSYSVVSSKGTSDHHIVMVDMIISKLEENGILRRQPKQRLVKIGNSSPNGIWMTNL